MGFVLWTALAHTIRISEQPVVQTAAPYRSSKQHLLEDPNKASLRQHRASRCCRRLVRLTQPRRTEGGRLLQGITRLAIGAPRRVIAVVLLVMVGTAIVGIPVSKSLSAGGMRDPTSESSQATKLLSDKFDQGDMAMIVTVTSNDGVESPATRAVGTDIVRQLQTSPHVVQVTSAWTARRLAPSLISEDGKTGLIVASISGSDNEAPKYARQLADELLHDRDGVTVRAGGEAIVYDQVNNQSGKDLLFMESLAIPLSFVVLVWVFGGLLAAALPIAVGGFAILGAMAALRTDLARSPMSRSTR